jgi:hypothetical protein
MNRANRPKVKIFNQFKGLPMPAGWPGPGGKACGAIFGMN